MATLGNLAVGTDVYDPFYNGINKDSKNVIWRIIGHNHDGSNTTTLVCKSLGSESKRWYCKFDQEEVDNPDDDIRANGNNRYDLSNIFQWLNSTASSNWFTPTHEYDAAPVFYEASETGFLYPFSSEFKNALISTTKPYRRYGESTTRNISGKVHLLSYSEITGQSYDGVSDGNQYDLLNQGFAKTSGYESAQSIMGLPSYEVSRTPSTNSKTENVSTIAKNNGSFTSNNSRALYNISNGFIITLPSSTKVSSDKYISNKNEMYAMFNMPLHIEVNDGKENAYVSLNGGETYNLSFKVFDEDYSVSSLVVSFNSDGSNPLKSLTNLTKKSEYIFTGNIRDLTKGTAKNLYFVATDSNGRTFTKEFPVTWVDAIPLISVYDNGEWKTPTQDNSRIVIDIGNKTKPPTFRLKFHDADDVDGIEDIYGYFCGNIFEGYYEEITTTPHDTEIEFTPSDNVWKNLPDGSSSYYNLMASTKEYSPSASSYNGSNINVRMTKSTPAPYIDIESTSIGRKNTSFIVKYTPKIDTIQTITNLKIYLDDTETLLANYDNPTPDVELSYEITKSALYDMSIGQHTLIFVVKDDLNQSTTTNVTFTRYNDAPNVITETSLGDKNLGFTGSFTIQDSESDISSVNVYIDDASGSPIVSRENVTTGTLISYEVSKSMLYDLELGNHNIIIVAADDNGSTTTNVSFTRTNNAPAISGNNALGNVNNPITDTLTVSDVEGDVFDVSFYIDNSITPFYEVNDIDDETQISYTLSRELLDTISIGNHTIRVVATDDVGQSNTFNVSFTRYNISPNVTISQDDVIHNGDFNVEYTVTDTDSADVSVVFLVDNNIVVPAQTVGVGQEHIQTIPMTNVSFGSHTLKIRVNDIYTSETPTEETLNFIYNSLPVIQADAIGKVADGFIEVVSVSDTDLDSVDLSVFIDDVIQVANIENVAHNTPINVTVSGVTFNSLAYGSHNLNIYARDTHNQQTVKNVSFEKHSKPSISIDTQIPEEVISAFSVTVTYENADGGDVSIKAYIDNQEIEL